MAASRSGCAGPTPPDRADTPPRQATASVGVAMSPDFGRSMQVLTYGLSNEKPTTRRLLETGRREALALTRASGGTDAAAPGDGPGPMAARS